MTQPSPTAPSNSPQAWRWASHPLFLYLLLAGATLFAYWPVVHADFINYDDNDYVTANPQVQAGLTWKTVTWAFTSNHASNWHPLTWLSHMLDVQLFGKGPTGPHCVNLLLHVLNSVLLFWLLRQMTGAQARSFLVAGLFALHPLHVESVAWVAERKDVLSTFFGLLTLLAYARYVKLNGGLGLKSKAAYGTTLLLFTLSLLSKPMLVTMPFVMLLLDFWPLRRFELSALKQQARTLLRLFFEKTPFLILSAASCAVTTWAQQKAMPSLENLSMVGRIENTVVSYARYLGKAFWPSNLALPYLHPGHWPPMQLTLAILVVAGLCLVAVLTARKHPYIFTGWFWYLGTLVPVIGLVQVGAQAMADRYTYVPLIGVFVVGVWSVGDCLSKARIPSAVGAMTAILILGICTGLTRQQAHYWHDSESLFKHSAAVTEGNFIALGNVGGVLFESGRLDEAMEYYQRSYQTNPHYPEALNSIGAVLAAKGSDEAMAWFGKVLALQPDHPSALFNMGNALAKQGKSNEAIRYFQDAIKAKPDNFEARNNLANALIKNGRLDEAMVQYRLALDDNPGAAMIHKNLGEMFAAKGKLDEAIGHYRQTLMQTNDPGTHYSLGLTLAVQGKWSEACEHYNAVLSQSPTNAEALYNLGYALRMQRRPEAAVKPFRDAIRCKREFPLAEFNLGCTLADLNQLEEAVFHLREALRLKPDYKEAQQKLRALEDQKSTVDSIPRK